MVSNSSNINKIGSKTTCYKKNEAVMICWDANPGRNEVYTTLAQRLMTSKWNSQGCHTEGSWRIYMEKDVDRHR